MRVVRYGFTAGVALASLLLSGCSDTQAGQASPSPSAGQGSGSAPSTTGTPGRTDSSMIDPCSLLSADELRQFGEIKNEGPQQVAGERSCQFAKQIASASEIGYYFDVGVRDAQGIAEVNDTGGGKQTGNVNGRPAVRAPLPPSGCLIALQLSGGSRVDVLVRAEHVQQACDAADKVADIVEPKLPKG
jgi:osmotically-inducible protein OsmY